MITLYVVLYFYILELACMFPLEGSTFTAICLGVVPEVRTFLNVPVH